MGERNSPMFKLGIEHGQRDTALESSCPPGMAIGPEPPYPAYRIMYDRGYDQAYQPVPCVCDGSCKVRSAGEAAEVA